MKQFLLAGLMFLFFVTPGVVEGQPGLQAGIQAPDFEAVTHKGEAIKLSDINKNGPIVLIFYRGGWCMYCNRQLQELQSRLGDFEAQGASIVAISVDLQENAAKSVEAKELGFTVISDPEANLLELYNLIYKVPDDLAKKYKEEYSIDLEAASGRSDHVIAIPAAYVIDRDGRIVFAYANRDYKVRANTDEILGVLKELIHLRSIDATE